MSFAYLCIKRQLMNFKTITILLAGLIGAVFTAGGAYLTIENLIAPAGQLFEGLVLMGIGILLTLMVMVAATIGKTVMIFSEILTRQVQIHKEQMQIQSGSGLSDLLSGMMGGKGTMTIKDLDNPNIDAKVIDLSKNKGKSLADIIKDTMDAGLHGDITIPTGGKKPLNAMTMDELQKALAKAIKKDDFERADAINKEIKVRQDLDNQEDTSENSK